MISVAIRADAPLERFEKTASAPQNYEKIIPPRSVIFHDNNVFRAILVVTWIGFAALLPLRCTLDLCTCVRGFKVYATIVIAEEQAESSGAYVGGRTVYLYGIIAVAVAFDPRCGRPFANAPCWVVLRATNVVSFIAVIRARCSTPPKPFPAWFAALEIGLACELEEGCVLVANLGANAMSLVVVALAVSTCISLTDFLRWLRAALA